jgi:ribosomal protein S27AE
MTDNEWSGDVMVSVQGEPFYCEECGSNVFRARIDDPLRYRCNGCGAMYRGEEKQDGTARESDP